MNKQKLSKEQLLVQIQSKFRKSICSAGIIHMGLYDLIEADRDITAESLAATTFTSIAFVNKYQHVWCSYSSQVTCQCI